MTYACKIETLGSLYSHALLVPTKIKCCVNRSLKIPQVAHVRLAQKGECWTWNQRLIRGLGSIGNILSLEFLFLHSKAFDAVTGEQPLKLAHSLLGYAVGMTDINRPGWPITRKQTHRNKF